MSVATGPAWKLRHQGSPRSIEGLRLPQIVEGLEDGLWEPTDEVMGPQDRQWVSIESHPQLAEIAADMEPPPAAEHEDETRIDMNPLIDVALVLLIVFILTMTYASLQAALEMPDMKRDALGKPIPVSPDLVKQFTIKVEATQVGDHPVIKVEDEVVDLADLVTALSRYVKSTRKTDILLDARGVTWDTVAHIQDAAKGAGVSKIHVLAQPGELQ